MSLLEADLRGISLYLTRLENTQLTAKQLATGVWEETAGRLREAQHVYRSLKNNFTAIGSYNDGSWAYIKERQMEKKCNAPGQARRFYGKEQLEETNEHRLPAYHPKVWWFFLQHTWKWFWDWVAELVCGYGERPLRTVAAMTLVFIAFVGTYWATWAVLKVEETSTAIVYQSTRHLADLVIFSLSAFTTMDPKGLKPAANWVQFMMAIEALLGIGLTGLLGFVLGNRIRRS